MIYEHIRINSNHFPSPQLCCYSTMHPKSRTTLNKIQQIRIPKSVQFYPKVYSEHIQINLKHFCSPCCAQCCSSIHQTFTILLQSLTNNTCKFYPKIYSEHVKIKPTRVKYFCSVVTVLFFDTSKVTGQNIINTCTDTKYDYSLYTPILILNGLKSTEVSFYYIISSVFQPLEVVLSQRFDHFQFTAFQLIKISVPS